jgi:putative sugar O-methyltransferase
MIFNPFYKEKLENLNIKLDVSNKTCTCNDVYHKEIVNKICIFFEEYNKLKNEISKLWEPAGEWLNYNDEKSFFYSKLNNENIKESEEYLKSFWRNKLGLIVKEYAKFEDVISENKEIKDAFINSIGRNYLIWKDLYNQPDSKLKLTNFVGNPWGCIINDEFVTPKATRFHSNAMQIKNIISDITQPVIAEIGGGYGGLAYYLIKEIDNCKYFNFDLPETLVLSAYHLFLNFPDKRIYLSCDNKLTDEIINNYDIFLLTNNLIENMPDKTIDIFFNSFSLSEMLPETNKAYLEQIERTTKHYFLHNNMDRKGVINRGFERIPASEYPIDKNKYILLNKNYDLFHSHFGDYKEFLYKIKS